MGSNVAQIKDGFEDTSCHNFNGLFEEVGIVGAAGVSFLIEYSLQGVLTVNNLGET